MSEETEVVTRPLEVHELEGVRRTGAENETNREVPLLNFKNSAPGTIFASTQEHLRTTAIVQYLQKKWMLYILSLAFLVGGLVFGRQHGLDEVACFGLACIAVFPSSKVSK
jgi:hypothetical protein